MTQEVKNACLFICMLGSGKVRNANVRLSGHHQGSKVIVSKERVENGARGAKVSWSIPSFSNEWVPAFWLLHETANIADKKNTAMTTEQHSGVTGLGRGGSLVNAPYDNQGLQSHLFQFTHKMWLSASPEVFSSQDFYCARQAQPLSGLLLLWILTQRGKFLTCLHKYITHLLLIDLDIAIQRRMECIV